MAATVIARQHVGLNFAGFTDKERHDLVAGVKLAAPTSQLVLASTGMQASLTALLAKDSTLAQASLAVVNDRAKLATDLTTEAQARNSLDGEIRTYSALAESGAKIPADLSGAGLPPRIATPRSTVTPDMPESIDTFFPKKGHGKATVAAHETGKVRRQYVAQFCADPLTPGGWAQLGVGHGKTRVLTGPSGTKIWVRMATVRGQLQSDWCPPVLVTLP